MKKITYLTEYPRYLDKENRWFRLRIVYTIGFLMASWPLNSNRKRSLKALYKNLPFTFFAKACIMESGRNLEM